MIPIPKPGDLTETGNWRGISLLQTVYKLFAVLAMRRFRVDAFCTHIFFLDISQAYDSVHVVVLQETLARAGMPFLIFVCFLLYIQTTRLHYMLKRTWMQDGTR